MDLTHALEIVSDGIGMLGAGIIVYGVLVGVNALIRLEWARFRGGEVAELERELRQRVGFYLLLSLEFLLAADLIETILAPSLEHVAVLGAIVLLRTIISWSLTWELRQTHG